MSLSLTTSSRPALESLNDGLRAMDRYYQSHRIPDIEQASQCIDAALAHDNHFGLAVFYKGVVLDLVGKPADAPDYFERILRECNEPDLAIETLFNLGLVNYHRFSHPYLERAKVYFEEVIEKAGDAKWKRLAQAHLAQAHAMWMRPSTKQLPNRHLPASPEVVEHIEHHFEKCQQLVAQLRDGELRDGELRDGELRDGELRDGELRDVKFVEQRIVATLENADGMSQMYYTDHVAREPSLRRHHLEIARAALLRADNSLPDDWANICDLGSVELRLAVLARDRQQPAADVNQHFSAAKEYLVRVVDELRPGYGFGFHELAILHRVWRKWNDARDYAAQAWQVAEKYRDISDKSVESELARIDEQDSSYP